jgi:hypothetical protein
MIVPDVPVGRRSRPRANGAPLRHFTHTDLPFGTIAHAATAGTTTRVRLALSPTDDTADDSQAHRF